MSPYKFIRLVEVQVNIKANDGKENGGRQGKYYSYGFLWSNEQLPLEPRGACGCEAGSGRIMM